VTKETSFVTNEQSSELLLKKHEPDWSLSNDERDDNVVSEGYFTPRERPLNYNEVQELLGRKQK